MSEQILKVFIVELKPKIILFIKTNAYTRFE